MSENTKKQSPEQEDQLSLNDDRRVKVLTPGAMVAKRFFRNRLAVVGMIMLIAMFLFSAKFGEAYSRIAFYLTTVRVEVEPRSEEVIEVIVDEHDAVADNGGPPRWQRDRRARP